MPALGPYLAALACLALFLGAVGLIAWRLRIVILPGWRGARARLAEAVLGVGVATTLCLALGTFSLLKRPMLLIAAVALAATVEWRFRRRAPDRGAAAAPPSGQAGQVGPEQAASEQAEQAGPGKAASEQAEQVGPQQPGRAGQPEQPRWSRLAALLLAAVVTAHWGIAVGWSLDAGITNFDSVWYHLPFAAEMAQSGSSLELVRTETVFLNWLYPQGSELLHAVGMVLTERDLASLAINLGWLGLAFLAAWCIGRPYGRGHLTVAAAAILLECHNVVARVPGTAKNDIMAVALLMAAAALLVNLAHDRPRSGPRPDPGSGPRPDSGSGLSSRRDLRSGLRPDRGSGLRPGPPLALAALAVGLAVGTKVTALAPAAGLTLAALAVCPAGSRIRASLWWWGGLALGGAYWYLRNIVVAGNPLPQVRSIGPIELPGPDRLQTGRPDFNVFHYLFDGPVWRDYLVPGLERGFGALWPLVIAAALLGGLLAAARLLSGRSDSERLLPWLGLAALLGMVAYLFTPLGAAGPEGQPTAFAINLRFAIPSLMLGLVLLPLCLPRLAARQRPRAEWAVFAGLVLICLVGNRADSVLTESGRLFGWALAIGLIALPALLLFATATGAATGTATRAAARSATRATTGAAMGAAARGAVIRRALPALAAVWLLALAAVGYPLQRGYFEQRYADFAPELGLSEVYRWAAERTETRIGLAGTTAGFHGFGFYGVDLSNRVDYLGDPAPRGGFDAIQSCPEFRRAVNAAGLDYLVTAPFLNFLDTEAPIPSPEARWIAGDPAIEVELEQGPVTLWRVTGELGERCGAAELPHRELPDSPPAASRDTQNG